MEVIWLTEIITWLTEIITWLKENLNPISPIIAVLLAWWTVRSSSKDTDKKIAAIEEGTKKQIDAIEKQIESIKQLAKLQAEITSLQLDKEHWETLFRFHEQFGQTDNVLADSRKNRESLCEVKPEEMTEEEEARYRKKEYYNNQLSNLEGHYKRLETIKRELDLK